MRADEQSLCRAMQGEYAMSRAAIASSAQEFGGVLVLDRSSTLARVAGNLGWACGAAATAALEADRPLPVAAPLQHDFGCLSNVMGCVLTDIAGPVYPAYSSRTQDAAAMLRLLGAQRWLRQQAGTRWRRCNGCRRSLPRRCGRHSCPPTGVPAGTASLAHPRQRRKPVAVGAVGGRRRPNRRCPRLSGGSVAAGLRIEHPAITNGLQRPAAAAAQWLPAHAFLVVLDAALGPLHLARGKIHAHRGGLS